MSILNRGNDGLLSLLIALYRCLRSQGPLPRRNLVALCAPPALGDPDQLGKTLRNWTKLGFFLQQGDGDEAEVSLAGPFQELAETPDQEFRCRLRALVFSEANNQNLTNRDFAADFTRALAWLLGQDVYSLPTDRNEIVALDLDYFQTTEPPFANNPMNWPAFPDWAAVLGFGWKSAHGIALDPTTAVLDVLEEVFAGGIREMPIGPFVSGLAGLLPVLDGGVYRRAVENQLHEWRGVTDAQLSVSLSRALVRLRQADTLRLERRGDAERIMQLLGRERRVLEEVSHVIHVPEAR